MQSPPSSPRSLHSKRVLLFLFRLFTIICVVSLFSSQVSVVEASSFFNASYCPTVYGQVHLYRPKRSAQCPLARGCATSYCSCLGLDYNESATSSEDPFPCVGLDNFIPSTLTCTNAHKCITDSVSCFQGAALASEKSDACKSFASPIYQHLISSFRTLQTQTLELGCAEWACITLESTKVLERCSDSLNLTKSCPVPTPARTTFTLLGENWNTVHTPDRTSLLRSTLRTDLEELLNVDVLLSSTEVARNGKGLIVNITVPSRSDSEAINIKIVTSPDGWLNQTQTVYSQFDGRGDISVEQSFTFEPTSAPITTVTPVTLAPATMSPTTEGPSIIEVPSTAAVCGLYCIVGIGVGVVVVVAALGAIAYCVLKARSIEAERNNSHSEVNSAEGGGSGGGQRAGGGVSHPMSRPPSAKPAPSGQHSGTSSYMTTSHLRESLEQEYGPQNGLQSPVESSHHHHHHHHQQHRTSSSHNLRYLPSMVPSSSQDTSRVSSAHHENLTGGMDETDFIPPAPGHVLSRQSAEQRRSSSSPPSPPPPMALQNQPAQFVASSDSMVVATPPPEEVV